MTAEPATIASTATAAKERSTRCPASPDPIGLGLAARDDIDDVVGWAPRGPRRRSRFDLDPRLVLRARRDHLRDRRSRRAISSTTADSRGEAGFRVALGAVNPNTRHPVVLAMTGSALDEMLPGRIVMAPGHRAAAAAQADGHPLRPGRRARRRLDGDRPAPPAVARRAPAVGDARACRRSSRCSRRPTGSRSIIAAYRREFVTLAGQKADGYLARPAESIASPRAASSSGSRAAATDAGRDPGEIETRGLPPVARRLDPARGAQPGQARAVRDLHDVGPGRRLAQAGRLRAGAARPDRGRLAGRGLPRRRSTSSPTSCSTRFMLCGTREDVAAGAMAFHAEAGLGLPLLQPVLQEDRQIDELIAAAALYAGLPAAGRSGRDRRSRRVRHRRRRRSLRRRLPAAAARRRVPAAPTAWPSDRRLGARRAGPVGGSAASGRSSGRSPTPPR